MNGSEILAIGRDAIWLTIQLCAPVLIVGLLVGVAIGLIQSLTQIQEQTLVYAPKIIAIFAALLLFLPMMGALLSGFMHEIAALIRGNLMMWAAAPELRIDPVLMHAAASSPIDDITSYFGTSTLLWTTGLIFLRLAGVTMLIPGLSETGVPQQVRLAFTLLLAMMLTPVIGSTLPPVPAGLGELIGQVRHEIIIGLILGTLMRVMIFTLVTAGEIISLQTGLSFAQTANPTEAQPSSSIGSFLAMLGLVLVYVTNTHHLFIRAFVDSYQVFSPVKKIMLEDAAMLMVRTLSQSFVLAMQMSAPLIVFALIFNIAVGFVGRVMPSFPVFFAATPLSLLLGLSLFALGVGSIGMVFIDHYQDMMSVFIRSR